MSLAPGSRLGPYEIVSPLGAGGMGEVYRARDTRLERDVAIKILPQNQSFDPNRKRRFLQEARAVSALNHPSIVMVFDLANDGGTDYLVMEYVAGKSLEKTMAAGRLPLPEAIDIVAQVCDALAAAHAAGIVHRDIKPANVMVTDELRAKVLDFGLAKLTESSSSDEEEPVTETALTQAEAIIGTVAYMSPEQAAGKSLDYRTDIFSLGVTLFEMIAGQNPFRGKSSVETMHAILQDPIPALEQPPELAEILAKALAKDPKERYQHAGDFALDLRRFLQAWKEKRLSSTQSSLAARKGSGLAWSMAAGLAAFLFAGIVLVRQLKPRGQVWVNPLENARFTRLTDFDGAELDAALSPDGRLVTFLSDRDGPFDAFVGQVDVGNFVNMTKGRFPELFHEQTRSVGFSGDGCIQ
jgi:eukaryotic-like serine/threonine-protein kinase